MNKDDYYKNIPAGSQDQLLKLQRIVVTKLGCDEQVISYQIPHFVLNGKRIVAIGGFKDHVSLFPLGSRQIKKYAAELAEYETSAGTIKFDLQQDLPVQIIEMIIEDRIQQVLE